MAAESPRKRLRDEATCSICLEYFSDPVALDCDHNFCRACITRCWEKCPTNTLCPLCKEPIHEKKFKPNQQVANFVELIKQLNDEVRKEAAGKKKCDEHEELLKLFCKDDHALICMVCDRSKKHKDHQVLPLEEAAQEYRDRFSSSLDRLTNQRKTILVHKSNVEEESRDLLKQVKEEKKKSMAEFKQAHQFLKQQEGLLLAKMELSKQEIVKKRNEHLASLSQELSTLDSIIEEMEQKSQLPVAELLQDAEGCLQRSEKEPFQNPVVFPLTLKWKIWEFWDNTHILEDKMKNFKETLTSKYSLQKANVTLNPDTAHPRLVVSEDQKSVTLADKARLSTCSKRFNHWACVEGEQEFSFGRHYWEVEVSNQGAWAVGVSRSNLALGNNVRLSPEAGIWAIGRWRNVYRAVYPKYPHLPLSGEPKRIRVSLNCDAQRVAFFDADTAALLHTFSLAESSDDTFLPFFLIWEKSHFRLCA